ncbi:MULTISPECIES: ImmA/IrrE family metallo-endopeptidase [unclassified Mesorhizobium]|uniref:ImmA/IrrE family metallo-endopeptidase n=1 Tax=unclassified Mesorhizobium TaxID=325217 RepID=UPI000FD38704|nr:MULTISPECIES: ImmA/IrrE family metallo-endopeptidase [unclassified Mesorhizobium]RUW20000.1 ImmA/IrrE family metallo-endopeptidase [Mesorhizobium sp. M4B.F.Ca.ET.013.02.1.1]TGV22735.1 ImmA/IrrE family metallo-endopeptidase [Mesorhizobium sp. M4B.F.Ca.ET.143.01.1.1]
MTVSRIDLADAATPEKLVLEILKNEPGLAIPVPIEAFARQLDIVDILPLETDGYEGGLITPVDKFNGSILFNQASPRRRRRFTIAHELGHFLMPSHVPSAEGRFLCRLQDMLALKANEADRRMKMEVEANRFAANILMPAPLFRKDAAAGKDPDLSHLVKLADKYDVSKEAASRSYVRYREEPVAVVIARHGKVLRVYGDYAKFPGLSAERARPVSPYSLLRRRTHQEGVPSDIDETDAGVWIDVQRGRKPPALYEQVLLQRDGFAMIMLSMNPPDEDEEDPEDDLTSAQRLRRRVDR